MGFPGGSAVKNLPAKREMRVPPRGQEAPWRRKWPPTPVFLPGESHGRRSLQGYSPWGHRRVRYNSATKQQEQLAYGVVLILLYSRVIQLCIYIYTHTHTYTHIHLHILFHCGLCQDIEYNFPCFAVGPCCLSILYITVCIVNPELPSFPPPLSSRLATTDPFLCL